MEDYREEVRRTLSITDDDHTLPTLTFRVLLLGLVSSVFFSCLNQIFDYKSSPLRLTAVLAQIASYPIGVLLAKILPAEQYTIPFTNKQFTLNPGPFNAKEHMLIFIFANTGCGGLYADNVLTIAKVHYHMDINYIGFLMFAVSAQMLGLGFAGIFTRFLVDDPEMWWPSNLVQVSFFRAFHEKDERGRRNTLFPFFLSVLIASFVYHMIVPGYYCSAITAISFVCWFGKDSVTVQQVGSGLKGLGIGSFGLDWNIAAGLGSPLEYPKFSIVNILIGYFISMCGIIPIAYWNNFYDSKKFPLISPNIYDASGGKFDAHRIMNGASFDIDKYNNYSKVNMPITSAFGYGSGVATLTAIISEVLIHYVKITYQMWREPNADQNGQGEDVHARREHYNPVPKSWYYGILGVMIIFALICCEGFNKELQLPWWGVLFALFIAYIFILPLGVTQAKTDLAVGLNVITELVIGYIYPGKPIANGVFKTFGHISTLKALGFLKDFKLAHYMKVPPREVFFVLFLGTLVSSITTSSISWWLLETKFICDKSKSSEDNSWSCSSDDVFYNASIIWGAIGPRRIFTNEGNYPGLIWFALFGLLAPFSVEYLAHKFPTTMWIKKISIPLILASASAIPQVRAVNYNTWGIVGILFHFYISKKYNPWWTKYSYILSAAMDASVAFASVLHSILQSIGISGPTWWGNNADALCPLAGCPTAPGIVVEGCPNF